MIKKLLFTTLVTYTLTAGGCMNRHNSAPESADSTVAKSAIIVEAPLDTMIVKKAMNRYRSLDNNEAYISGHTMNNKLTVLSMSDDDDLVAKVVSYVSKDDTLIFKLPRLFLNLQRFEPKGKNYYNISYGDLVKINGEKFPDFRTYLFKHDVDSTKN